MTPIHSTGHCCPLKEEREEDDGCEARRAARWQGGVPGKHRGQFAIDGRTRGVRWSDIDVAPLAARRLRARCSVVEGCVGALLGDEVLIANPGDLVFKPRNQWHTFWNAGDEPARILEIISPAGFERFFGELVDLGGVTHAEPQILADLCARYGLEMDPASVPGLVERFRLRFPGEPI